MKKTIRPCIYAIVCFIIIISLICFARTLKARESKDASRGEGVFLLGDAGGINIEDGNANTNEDNTAENKNEAIVITITWKKGSVEVAQNDTCESVECYVGGRKSDCAETYVRENSEGYEIDGGNTNESVKVILPKSINVGTLNLVGMNDEIYVHGVALKNMNIETENGVVHISGVNAEGMVKIETRNGDVVIKGTNSQLLVTDTTSGDISLEGYSAEYYLHTENGDINFTPIAVGTRSDLVTKNGDVYAEFDERDSFCAYIYCDDERITTDRRLLYSISGGCYVYNDGENNVLNVLSEEGNVEIKLR